MVIVDISHYQGDINWEIARKEIDLIIFRASIDYRNDDRYWDYAKKCQVPFGVYHFLKASNRDEAAAEAKFFYETATANGLKPLFFCADIEHENQNANNIKEISEVFADTLRSLGAKKLGLYIGQSNYPYANKEKYDFIWIPRYGKNSGNIEQNYIPKYPCDLWQYTSNGYINGINTRVDLNTLHGDKNLNWFLEKEETKMAESFTNTHFVEFCKKFVGQPYWYGTCVYACSKDLLQSKTKQYSQHYGQERKAKYEEQISKHLICADCVGLIKGYVWTNGGENVIESIGLEKPLFKNSYQSNGMPDKSANGLFDYAKSLGLEWGTIDTIPEIPGIAVRYDGHVGIYIGNGEVVEERGFNYGCVKTKLSNRGWLNWYKIPCIKYINEPIEVPTTNNIQLGSRLLKKGMTGADVKELQTLLNEVINAGLNVDGDYGTLTENAVKKFQEKYNLEVDGKYGSKTHAALMSAIADMKPDIENEPVVNTEKKMMTSCAANVRAGDSTSYSIITTLPKGTKLDMILNENKNYILSENKWYAIKCTNQIGWISDSVVMEG